MTTHISDQKPQRLPTDYHDLVSAAAGYKLLAEARQHALEAALQEISDMRHKLAHCGEELTIAQNYVATLQAELSVEKTIANEAIAELTAQLQAERGKITTRVVYCPQCCEMTTSTVIGKIHTCQECGHERGVTE